MSPPDDAPPAARLARWSEWWFTPRWRALLTWVALTAIAASLLYAKVRWINKMVGWSLAYMNRFLPAPLPLAFRFLARDSTGLLLVTWFEPLALRLSLGRGLAWLGLTIAAPIVLTIVIPPFSSPGTLAVAIIVAAFVGIGALQCCALRGWRSRPWMGLPARALTVALLICGYSRASDGIWHWLIAVVVASPGAALLLYGTRLLRPEERALSRRRLDGS